MEFNVKDVNLEMSLVSIPMGGRGGHRSGQREN